MSGSLGPLGIRELSYLSHRLDHGMMSSLEEKRLLFILDKISSPTITLNQQERAVAQELLAKVGRFPSKGHYDLFVKYIHHQIKQPPSVLNDHSFKLLREWADSTANPSIINSVKKYIIQKKTNPEGDYFLSLNTETDLILPDFFLTDPTFANVKLQISPHILLPEDVRLEQIENGAVYAQIEYPIQPTAADLPTDILEDTLPTVTHDDIIHLLKAAGFVGNSEGICQGIAELGCRYLILGKVHLFDQQIINISKLLEFFVEDETELEHLSSQELQETCDILSPNFYTELKNFLGKIELSIHDSSIFYKEVLGSEKPFHHEMDEIGTAYTIITPTVFVDKLIRLKEIIQKNNGKEPIAISIKNINHAISIGYDPQKNLWYFINANLLQHRCFQSEKKLIEFIFYSFRLHPDTLSLTFYAGKNLSPPLAHALQDFLKTDPILALSVEKAQIMPQENLQILLNAACEKGSLDTIKILLTAGVNPNTPNLYEQTPLCVACIQNNLDVVKLLVSSGAIINYRSSEDDNPFLLACFQKNLKIADFLITQGAIVDTQDSQGITALYHACQSGSLDVVKLLLEKKANPNIITKFGTSPLLIATCTGHIEIVRELLTYEAYINHTAPDGSSALSIACEQKQIPLIRLLLERGALDNKADKNGNNLLCLASLENDLEIASLLAENEEFINHLNKAGFTPLHIACIKGNPRMVSMLLQKGADRDLQTLDGKTPLQIATEEGRSDIIAILEKKKEKKRKTPMTGHEGL